MNVNSLISRMLWSAWQISRPSPRFRRALIASAKRLGLYRWATRRLAESAASPYVSSLFTKQKSSEYGVLRPYIPPPEDKLALTERRYLAEREARGTAGYVVLSVISGGYERPARHEWLSPLADYVLVTDISSVSSPAPQRVKPLDYFDVDPVRAARFVKTHPFCYAPDAKVVVWLDSNLVLRQSIDELVARFIASGMAVGAVPHPERRDLYEEAKTCIARRKDSSKTINAQTTRYRAEKFTSGFLAETSFMMFRSDREAAHRFLSEWWKQIESGSRRDQLSFEYALKQAEISYFRIFEPPESVRTVPQFALISHDANRPHSTSARRSFTRESGDRGQLRDTLVPSAVDVIVCVHDAMDVTRACLNSLQAGGLRTIDRLIIVDDGSNEPTRKLLEQTAATFPNCKLIRNSGALGYTKAANIGLAISTADFVILLNSDTLVAPNFAMKLARAVLTVPGAGIVGPLSNAASAQSIPNVFGDGSQTAINSLPAGWTVVDMDHWCEQHAGPFPRVPLVHGFCFGISRSVINRIGLLDEKHFPYGYGEEDDYCIRAADAGFSLAVATDTFVFHAKTQSYSVARRTKLTTISGEVVAKLHGSERIRRNVLSVKLNPILEELRDAARRL